MDLVGAWRLVEWRIGAPGSAFSHPFGRDAVGLLCYTPDGYMSMTVSRAAHAPSPTRSSRSSGSSGSSRDAPTRTPVVALAAQAQAAVAGAPGEASASFYSYAGRYEVREGQIAHDVEVSFDRSMAGVVQVRELNINGDRLVLAASERGCWHTMIWRRS
ncbi:lipocalin-like domain-containing protein [Streptosporangium sp. NPDC023615]|uniref:lipocalin-like domain-containing protein n=1 Tax=Streptosporangium sp. NPDC023615 TaxID=3154794 RepID=UPI0034403100